MSAEGKTFSFHYKEQARGIERDREERQRFGKKKIRLETEEERLRYVDREINKKIDREREGKI